MAMPAMRHCRIVCDHYVLFLAADVDASEAAYRSHFEDIDICCFLGLVGGQCRIAGRLDFEHEEGLPGENHVAVTHAVDQHALGVLDVTDYLVGDYPRLMPVLLFEAQRQPRPKLPTARTSRILISATFSASLAASAA